MKKLSILIVVIVLAALFMVGTHAFAQEGTPYRVINAPADGAIVWDLNNPGTELARLENGAEVMVLSTTTEADPDGFYWASLVEPANGFINLAFLEPVQPVDPFEGLLECTLGAGEAVKYDNGQTPQENETWVFDPSVTGCLILFEGRLDPSRIHHIYVLRGANAEEIYFGQDGLWRYMEGSIWFYGRGTNMDDPLAGQTIASEFHDAKRINMQQNGYDWPIWLHNSAGNVMEFSIGTLLNVVLPDNCQFAAPQKISVHGIYDAEAKVFNASIGAEGCITAAWLDGSFEAWENARDNVAFTTVEAWLMPGLWDTTQVQAWVDAH